MATSKNTEMAISLGNSAPLPSDTNIAPLPNNKAPEPLSPAESANLLNHAAENSLANAIPIPPVLEVKDEEEEAYPYDGSKAIAMLPDAAQKINREILENIGESDADWQYNMTLGDLAQYKVQSISDKNKTAEYWFAMNGKSTRKVFVSGKVLRLSDINSAEETFRCSASIVMYWYLTKDEYDGYLIAKQHNGLEMWTPDWFPVLRYVSTHCTVYSQNVCVFV